MQKKKRTVCGIYAIYVEFNINFSSVYNIHDRFVSMQFLKYQAFRFFLLLNTTMAYLARIISDFLTLVCIIYALVSRISKIIKDHKVL